MLLNCRRLSLFISRWLGELPLSTVCNVVYLWKRYIFLHSDVLLTCVFSFFLMPPSVILFLLITPLYFLQFFFLFFLFFCVKKREKKVTFLYLYLSFLPYHHLRYNHTSSLLATVVMSECFFPSFLPPSLLSFFLMPLPVLFCYCDIGLMAK
ncbi:unnamed protein product [Trypanosoma congolense IL3000]|uniref:WGS project CAEQ00000000 data, annotated contig 78 n=1 Tax=Trypanosoma congolense (strain IL3000) TaxID=1068625 RepID=F9WIG9_TRYCI|nr:unnamed protein product [Trypanosoma congolense IL3000]